MDAQLTRNGKDLLRGHLALRAPGVHPEERIARVTDLGAGECGVGGSEMSLCGVNGACRVAVKHATEGRLELGDRALSRLPARRGTKQHAVPGLIEDCLAVIVPRRVEDARRS